MNHIPRHVATGALAVSGALLSACGGSGGASSGNSTLNLGLTDAPVTGVTKVWIQFTGVEVKPANGDPIDFNFKPEKGFDLLTPPGWHDRYFPQRIDDPGRGVRMGAADGGHQSRRLLRH
jgi:hypothetical protein